MLGQEPLSNQEVSIDSFSRTVLYRQKNAFSFKGRLNTTRDWRSVSPSLLKWSIICCSSVYGSIIVGFLENDVDLGR